MSPTAGCPNAACAQRFEQCDRQLDELRDENRELRSKQSNQGERLAAIEGRLALAAAFGATVGGGLVSAITKFLR